MLSKKSMSIVLLVVVLLTALIAPGANAQDQKKWVIGGSLMNTSEPFYLDLEKGWRDAAKAFGVEVIVTSAEADLAAQVSQAEDFIVKKVDAMILIPADSAGIVPAVEKANAANIPVFTADINAEGGKITSFIASDNYAGGALAADYLAKEIGEEGEIVVLGHPSISSTFQRTKGFIDTIKAKYPKVKIAQELEIQFTRDDAMKKTEDMLVTYPNLKGVFGATGGDAGMGALAAIEAANKTGIKVVNFDAIPESRKAIMDGSTVLTGDVAQFPYDIGYQSMKAAVDFLNGKQVPPETQVAVSLVTKDSLYKVGDQLLVKGHETYAVPEGKKVTVGGSLMNTSEPFYLDLEKGWRDAAKDFGADAVVTSAEADLAAQVSQAEDFIVKKVDAMILIPADSAGIVPAVEKANAANIPVFTADINADGGKIVSFIASDNYAGGVLAADHLAKEIGEEGEVVVLGHPSITSTFQRTKGFIDTIKAKYPKIKIVQELEIQFTRDDAMKKTEDMLVTYPNLKGIFGATGGDAGMGALAAIEAANKTGIKVVNFDAIPESRKVIMEGSAILTSDVAQFPYKIGYESMKAAIAYLRGVQVPPQMGVEVAVVTKDNLVKTGDQILVKGYETAQ